MGASPKICQMDGVSFKSKYAKNNVNSGAIDANEIAFVMGIR